VRLVVENHIRTPGTGLWKVKGYNLENYGVPPDVDGDNTPADFLPAATRSWRRRSRCYKMSWRKRSRREWRRRREGS